MAGISDLVRPSSAMAPRINVVAVLVVLAAAVIGGIMTLLTGSLIPAAAGVILGSLLVH